MTISVTTQKLAFTGDGTDKALSITYKFYASSDLIVTKRITATGVESMMVLDTHYSVSGGSGATGTVTVIDGATNFPSTVTWTVTRSGPLTQITNYVEGDDFGAESHETVLDKIVLMLQDHKEILDRCLKIPVSDTAGTTVELPVSDDRETHEVITDASGNFTTQAL